MRRAGERTSSWGKGVFFEEIADFVSRGEKVIVADMAFGRARVLGGEFCEWVGREGDVGKETVGFVEKSGDFWRGKESGEDQVAIFVVGGELAGS